MGNSQIEESYGHKARIQLSFSSYMRLSLFISVTFALTMTLVLNLLAQSETASRINVDSLNQWITLYTFLGFLLFNLASAALSYVAYRAWCQQQHGLKMTGKFALQIDDN
ncbi:hypothetical protein GCM10011369_16680 [Neiella marina]|uniref:Uncharacterized protein n=1 Tax=Neiella marina TaxID=508461 RepID=A0A8J2XNS1_9GAMM|nr:hypothetical protein [Neiella marina]GGA75471.1 hypothetical protein GCM10011369_16680 [Neiella marina]